MAVAGTDGRDDASLTALLWREPYRFDYRQAVRLLERLAGEHVKLADGSDPRREAVLLRGTLSFRFPPSDIEMLSPAVAGGRPEITVSFFGLGGAHGPLPPPLTARLLEQARRHDEAGRDFLDIFNHRLLSILLRHSRLFFPVLHHHAAADSTVGRPLRALLGLGTLPASPASASAAMRLGGTLTSLLEASGLLNSKPASTHALQRLLAAHFALPVRVGSFRGGWLRLDDDQRSRLGRRTLPLGAGATLGGRAWDQGAAIRIDLGPMGLAAFRTLLPGGAAHAQLGGLVRFVLGDAFDVELHAAVRADETPTSRLGGKAGPLLGWTSWLGGRTRDAPGVARLRLARG